MCTRNTMRTSEEIIYLRSGDSCKYVKMYSMHLAFLKSFDILNEAKIRYKRANFVSFKNRMEMKTPFKLLFFAVEKSKSMMDTGMEDSRSTTNQLFK